MLRESVASRHRPLGASQAFARERRFRDLACVPGGDGFNLDATRFAFDIPNEDVLQLTGVEGCGSLHDPADAYRVTLGPAGNFRVFSCGFRIAHLKSRANPIVDSGTDSAIEIDGPCPHRVPDDAGFDSWELPGNCPGHGLSLTGACVPAAWSQEFS
jgi:hypothetical protein